MAGLTDHPYRLIAKRFGVDVMVTEFASAKALLLSIEKQEERIHFADEERPVGVQIFGADPAEMARAARLIEAGHAPDFIDINFGCPARKIVEKNGGSGCLRDPVLLGEITAAVVEAVRLPVTAKMRIGWERFTPEETTLRLAGVIEGAGVSAIAVHGRPRGGGYSAKADWDRIAAVRRALSIPVIGNGDVFEPEDAGRMLDETGVAALMIGRGAVGRPWIFDRVKRFLRTGELLPEPGARERFDLIMEHVGIAVELGGDEARTVRELRRHLAAYTKGLPGAARLRARLFALESAAEIRETLSDFLLRRAA